MFLYEDLFKEAEEEDEVEISVTSIPDIDISIYAPNQHDYDIERDNLDDEELRDCELEALRVFWKPIADELRQNPLIIDIDIEGDPDDGIGCFCKRKDVEELMKFIKGVFDKFIAEKHSIRYEDCEISYTYTAGSYFYYDTYENTANVDIEVSIADYVRFNIY